MDTLKLNNLNNPVCGVDIYSGRENPEWNPDSNLAGKIESIFESLNEISTQDLKESPVIGYRGAFIKGEGIELYASSGKVTVYKNGNAEITKSDDKKEIEKAIVESAPPDLEIPWDFIKSSFE